MVRKILKFLIHTHPPDQKKKKKEVSIKLNQIKKKTGKLKAFILFTLFLIKIHTHLINVCMYICCRWLKF